MTLRVHPDEIVAEGTSPLLVIHPAWERVRLGEIAVVQNGCAFPSSAFGPSGDMPLIRIRDVGKGTTATWYSGPFDAQYVVEPGSLIIGMDGDFRVEEWRGARALLNQRVCKVTVSQRRNYSHKFLRWALPGYLDAVHRETSSVTVKHLSSETVKELPLPLPPRAEQDRIVAAIEEQFSRLDAAEALLRSALGRLASLRINVVTAAYASDWPWTTLGEIAEIAGGVTKNAKRQGDPSFVEVPYLRVANVQRGYLDLKEVTTIRVSPEKAKALALEPGDVLFNEGGDRDKLGRGWVWSGEIDRCIHQNHVFRARLMEGFDPRFVSWHGNTFGQRWFNTHGRQTTNLASLNLTTLKSFPVPAPSLSDQHGAVAEIDRQLSIIDATTKAVRSAVVQGGVLRNAVLNCAFSGNLVPQDPSDEPASLLLDRIVADRESSDNHKPRRRRKATA